MSYGPELFSEECNSRVRSVTLWQKLFFFGGRGNFEDGEEGFLGNVHLADALHAALAFFLFFEKFAFAGNVAAVAFGENVFADGGDGFARDDAAANGGLNRHFKHLPRNQFSQGASPVRARAQTQMSRWMISASASTGSPATSTSSLTRSDSL